jgi:hypothetical protein
VSLTSQVRILKLKEVMENLFKGHWVGQVVESHSEQWFQGPLQIPKSRDA